MKALMHRLILCKIAGTILLAGLLVATSEAVTDDASQMPIYNAPHNVTPRARLGGTLRGNDGNDPVVAALVPDHVGITVRQHPELNWFLSKHTTLPIRFTLIDERSVRALIEQSITAPNQPGVHTIKLGDVGFALQPNVQYRWYISVIKDTDSPSQDIVTGGIIERCEFSECVVLDATTACSREAILASAAKGFWYDAMACLCDLIESNPADMGLRKQRVALLKQVGLHEVAEWDLAQSHAFNR